MMRSALAIAVMVAALLFGPAVARAQDGNRPLVWDVAKKVLVDPTTYAPAVISFAAMRWDWRTSQVLFDRGWIEGNPQFTVSGRPNDVPMSYAEGNRLIR